MKKLISVSNKDFKVPYSPKSVKRKHQDSILLERSTKKRKSNNRQKKRIIETKIINKKINDLVKNFSESEDFLSIEDELEKEEAILIFRRKLTSLLFSNYPKFKITQT